MKPLPDKIRILRDEMFTASGPSSPMAQGQPLSLMLADGARVRILNGTSTPQLEMRTRNYLSGRGIRITEVGETKPSSRTTIVLFSPKLYALRFLLDVFDITRSSEILIKPDPSETVDVEIRLGNDWVGKLPTVTERQPHPHEIEIR